MQCPPPERATPPFHVAWSTCWCMATTNTVQRGGAVFGCTGGTSSSRCKCSRPRTSTTPPHGERAEPGAGGRHEMYYTAAFRKRLPPRVPGHPVWVSRGGHRHGSSSGPWSSSPTSCPWFRFWILLCRRWLNSCLTSCVAACSRAGYRSAQDLHRAHPAANRSSRHAAGGTAGGSADDHILFFPAADYGAARRHSSSSSWRATPWSSRFFSQTERVQQLRLPPRNAFLSGLWRRSSIFPVEAFKIFAQDRAHPLLRTDAPGDGFFALFPTIKKCEVGFALGVGTAPRVEPIHAGCSAPCSSQAVGHDLG